MITYRLSNIAGFSSIKYNTVKKVLLNLNSTNLILNCKLIKNLTMTNETKKLKTDVISKIGTHNGVFHCDEVLACFMLLQLKNAQNAEIIRSRDPEVLKTCDIVVDVGQVFDVEKNLFDHHQRSFNETFSSLRPEFGDKYNIKLSSAGLVYTFFGEEVVKSILKQEDIVLDDNQLNAVYEQTYKSLIMEIDAIDNGVPICEGEQKYFINTHLSARVQFLNPHWNETKKVDENKLFEEARNLVGEELKQKILFCARVWLPARDVVKTAILNAKLVHPSGEIIEFESVCPWKDHLFILEEQLNLKGLLKYVIFRSGNEDWRVMCVPNEPKSFVCRKFLHKKWRGLQNIGEISGIKDAKFCHATGFIGGALTRKGVLEMAIKSLESTEE